MKNKGNPTIYDIAKALSVSAPTVSRALKNHPSISAEMRRKIQSTAEALGYRPNTFATNLRNRSTRTLGIMIPRIDSAFMARVIAGAEEAAARNGYSLLIAQSAESVKNEAEAAQMLLNKGIDGLLVSLTTQTCGTGHFEGFTRSGVPVVFFDRIPDSTTALTVSIDNRAAAFEAVSHLLASGRKRIAMITSTGVCSIYAQRVRGYREALSAHGQTVDEQLIVNCSLSLADGIEALEQLLQLQQPPDAVFAVNDTTAAACLTVCRSRGLSVPGHLAIVGFNNDQIAQVCGLSTVDYPAAEMGRLAAESLVSLVANKTDMTSTRSILLRSRLIVRESSRADGVSRSQAS